MALAHAESLRPRASSSTKTQARIIEPIVTWHLGERHHSKREKEIKACAIPKRCKQRSQGCCTKPLVKQCANQKSRRELPSVIEKVKQKWESCLGENIGL